MNKTRVALYIRVSTAEQGVKGVSIDSQKADLIKFSKDN
jgi:DNA invertase Pin-like site-specific DNA recombinase